MAQMQISLPDSASDFIQQQVAAGHYRSADEFLSELVEQARAMATDERLAALIQEGLDSGEGEEINAQWWRSVDDEVRGALQRRQSA